MNWPSNVIYLFYKLNHSVVLRVSVLAQEHGRYGKKAAGISKAEEIGRSTYKGTTSVADHTVRK
jgi:hypothetical protein